MFETRLESVDDRLERVSGPKKGDEPDNHPELHNKTPGLVGTGVTVMIIVITKVIVDTLS